MPSFPIFALLTRGPFTARIKAGDKVPMTDGTTRLVIETDPDSLTLPVLIEGCGWYGYEGQSYRRYSPGPATIAEREATPDIAVIKLAKEQRAKPATAHKINARMPFRKSKSRG